MVVFNKTIFLNIVKYKTCMDKQRKLQQNLDTDFLFLLLKKSSYHTLSLETYQNNLCIYNEVVILHLIYSSELSQWFLQFYLNTSCFLFDLTLLKMNREKTTICAIVVRCCGHSTLLQSTGHFKNFILPYVKEMEINMLLLLLRTNR